MIGSVVSFIAEFLGSTEPATRLLLSLLLGYPLSFIYRCNFLYRQPAAIKQSYFILSGLAVCYFNFGWETYHSLLNISVIYALLKIAGGTKLSVAVTFIFNSVYLILGYLHKTSETGYYIAWTTPHCVLVLRLSAVAFDLYDGHKRILPAEAKDSALKSCPSWLEIMGHCYFFGGFLVGPQYSMRRYLSFLRGAYSDPAGGGPPNTLIPALNRFLLGVAYVGAYQVFSQYVHDEYLESADFQGHSLAVKCAVIVLWGKNCLNKYIGCWLLTEGAIIYCGLSHNVQKENGEVQWDGCTNVQLKQLESASTLHHVIASFNMNTNLWMSKYIFKRLMFLGNKLLSQFITLLYLAIWHGLLSGYFVCFLLEFAYTACEREVITSLKSLHCLLGIARSPLLRLIVYSLQKLWSSFLISYALVAFSLLHADRWWKVYASTSYIGFVMPAMMFTACYVSRQVLRRRSSQSRHVAASPVPKAGRYKSD